MNYIEFRREFIDVGCVSTNQIVSAYPDFNSNNLTRWVKQGFLIKLRQGYYSFSELQGKSDFALYISNRIYKPSYISLHTVLAFYGAIPEAVTQITAVSSLKTTEFENSFGVYTYKKVREDLIFGYELKPFNDTRQKGCDFYDAMFLLGQSEPDYDYLAAKQNIHNKQELRQALNEIVTKNRPQKEIS